MSLLRPDLLPEISGKTIILDTNALVEGYSSPNEFSLLLNELSEASCGLTAIEAIRIEFLSKNRSTQELEKKINFYNATLTFPELPNKTFETQLREPSLLYAFGMQSNTFKAVDYMIAAAMKKYSAMSLLLTNDHHDFTPQLFDLVTLVPLTPVQGCIIPFGLYMFSEDKYAALLGS